MRVHSSIALSTQSRLQTEQDGRIRNSETNHCLGCLAQFSYAAVCFQLQSQIISSSMLDCIKAGEKLNKSQFL